MLYDPKWEVEVKTDPFSLESLIAWLETMPKAEKYDYWNCEGKCLYGQYMAVRGISWENSGHYDRTNTKRASFCEMVYAEVACEQPYTFGAALDRARKTLAVA